MIRTTVVLLAVMSPVSALAQDPGLGLDLTDDKAKTPPKPEEEKPAEAAPGTETLPTPAPAAETPVTEKREPGEVGEQAEKEVILEDRVKAVQRKVYLKKHRLELSPLFGISVNDPYYPKLTAAIQGAYYLADTLALAARLSYVAIQPTEDVRTAEHAFSSRIFYSRTKWSAMGDAIWSPIYGKVSIFNSILHLDAFILGGMGVVNAVQDIGTVYDFAFDLGVGLKFVVKDYLAVDVALINTSYVDTPVGTTQSITQNMMTLNVGVSLFIPFKSTGRESE